jgi:transposase
MIVAEKQRAMRFSNKRLQQSIARLIKALEKELASLDTDIDATVRGSPAWREKEDLLISVPGVGVRRALCWPLFPSLAHSAPGVLDQSSVVRLSPAKPAWER